MIRSIPRPLQEVNHNFCGIDDVLDFLDSVTLKEKPTRDQNANLGELSLDMKCIAEFLESTGDKDVPEMPSLDQPLVVSARKVSRRIKASPDTTNALSEVSQELPCESAFSQFTCDETSVKTCRRVKRVISTDSTTAEVSPDVPVTDAPLPSMVDIISSSNPPVITLRKKPSHLPIEPTSASPVHIPQDLEHTSSSGYLHAADDLSSWFEPIHAESSFQPSELRSTTRRVRRVKKPKERIRYTKKQLLDISERGRCLQPPEGVSTDINHIRLGHRVSPDFLPAVILERNFNNEVFTVNYKLKNMAIDFCL